MMHLDPRTYEGLLAGTLPSGEARALAQHLATDCEVCERFLAERSGADALDGRSDAAIDRAFPPGPLPDDDLAFARVERRLRAGSAGRRRLLTLAAVAASLLVVGVAGLWTARQSPSAPTWDGVKGEARPPRARLRLTRLDTAGAAVRGVPGETVDAAAELAFEVELDRAADVALARVQPGGDVELLWRARLPAGRTVVGKEGRAAAYPLASLRGRQRFALVASEQGLDDALLAQALATFRASRLDAASQVFGTLSLDSVEISVH